MYLILLKSNKKSSNYIYYCIYSIKMKKNHFFNIIEILILKFDFKKCI